MRPLFEKVTRPIRAAPVNSPDLTQVIENALRMAVAMHLAIKPTKYSLSVETAQQACAIARWAERNKVKLLHWGQET